MNFNNSYKASLFFVSSIFFLLIYNHWLPLLVSGLFTLFILDFLHTYLKNKRTTFIASIFVFTSILIGIVQFCLYLSNNYQLLLNINLNEFKPLLTTLKIPVPHDFDLNYIIKLSTEYIKSNLAVLSGFGVNSLLIILGIMFGFLFFFFEEKQKYSKESNWFKFIEANTFYLNSLFSGFKTIMRLQVMVAILNTFSLFILSFVIAPILTGETLPYWYILLPLTILFSLIPVIGNLIINLLIFFISISISALFTFVAIAYFFLVHKLELIVIAKLLGKKEDIPFLYIAIGMLLGELVFNSMLGILFGITLLLTIRNILLSFDKEV
jgi:predicted PurR-regulated permease PerM